MTGRYSGSGATPTEEESGRAVEAREQGPLKPNSAGHRVLFTYRHVLPMSAYEASFRAAGDYHSKRRESTRLAVRGFLRKKGTVHNPAQDGREVDAFILTIEGAKELVRLGVPT